MVGNNGKPKVWKNGISETLPYTNYGITMEVRANSIFVK
jgi:hypothetical protein